MLMQGGLQLSVTLEDPRTNSCNTTTTTRAPHPPGGSTAAAAAPGDGEGGCLHLSRLASCSAVTSEAETNDPDKQAAQTAEARDGAAAAAAEDVSEGGTAAAATARAAVAAAAAAAEVSEGGDGGGDNASEMDAVLLQLLRQHGKAILGHHTFFLLPEGVRVQGGQLCTSSSRSSSGGGHNEPIAAAAAGGAGGGGGSNKGSKMVRNLILGEHYHAWAHYTLFGSNNSSTSSSNGSTTRGSAGSGSEDGSSSSGSSSALVNLSTAAAQAAGDLLQQYLTLHTNINPVLTAAAQLPISPAGQMVLSFSLLNSDPKVGGVYDWDFSGFEERFLSPLIEVLAPVVQVAVESQVLLYTRAAVDGTWSREHKSYVVPHDQLPFFVDSEWPIESSGAVTRPKETGETGVEGYASANLQPLYHQQQQQQPLQLQQGGGVRDPAAAAAVLPHVLHFAVYIPPLDQQPLLLLERDGRPSITNSFWIASWGGLAVVNPSVEAEAITSPLAAAAEPPQPIAEAAGAAASSEAARTGLLGGRRLSGQEEQQVAGILVAQLHELLGLPLFEYAGTAGVKCDESVWRVSSAGLKGFHAAMGMLCWDS